MVQIRLLELLVTYHVNNTQVGLKQKMNQRKKKNHLLFFDMNVENIYF